MYKMKNDIENKEIAFLSRKILDLNKQLIDSEKAKSRFLSLVANSLINPISVLLSMVPHLVPENDERRQKIYAMVHEQVLVLDFRIQNLLTAAEIENGKVDVSYSLIDPTELVNEAINSLKYPILEKNIEINIKNTLECKIVTDPQKLYIIIRNLLDNGCYFGIKNGVIDVVIGENNSTLSIAVKNQGEGPKVEHKPQVFTRFAHGPEGYHGLGLGLSVVRDLCELMDGSIDYDSDASTVTFTVTLPLETALKNSDACGSNEFLFESFDDAIEL
jgi:signal transduction histidine kinase